MASPIEAFKARISKDVTLPSSGLIVEITLIDCIAFLGLGELPISTAVGAASQEIIASSERAAKNLAYADRAIAMGAVRPPFSDRPEDKGRTDLVHVTDLPFSDRMYLGEVICEWSGLNTDWSAKVQSFREDTQRPPGESPGGTLPQAPQ